MAHVLVVVPDQTWLINFYIFSMPFFDNEQQKLFERKKEYFSRKKYTFIAISPNRSYPVQAIGALIENSLGFLFNNFGLKTKQLFC